MTIREDDPSSLLLIGLAIAILTFLALGLILVNGTQTHRQPLIAASMFTYYGTEGPFGASSPDGGKTWDTEEPISRVAPGGRFAWTNDMKLADEISACVTYTLFHIDTRRTIRTDRQCADWPGGEQQTVRTYEIPADAPEGHYELRRTIMFHKHGDGAVTRNFPPILIVVAREGKS